MVLIQEIQFQESNFMSQFLFQINYNIKYYIV